MTIKKGQVLNPAGGPKLPPEVKTMRTLTYIDLHVMLRKYLLMTREEIKAATEDPKATMLELMIAAVIKKGITEGDVLRLNAMCDRLFGKPKESLKIETETTIKVEHLRANEIRTIIEADPFLEQRTTRSKHKRLGSSETIEVSSPTGSGEKRFDPSDPNPGLKRDD